MTLRDRVRLILENQAGVGEECKARMPIEQALDCILQAVREEYDNIVASINAEIGKGEK